MRLMLMASGKRGDDNERESNKENYYANWFINGKKEETSSS